MGRGMTKRLGPCGIRPEIYRKLCFDQENPATLKVFILKMAFVNLGFRFGVHTNLVL